jgi:hypothetical protein
VNNVLDTLDKYCAATGSKVNMGKSEILLLGKARMSTTPMNIPIQIKTDCIEVLGIYMGPDKEFAETLNWKNKIAKAASLLGWWKARKLTLQGKAVVINTLFLSRFWYLFTNTPVPIWVENRITEMCRTFLWNSNSQIKKSTIIGKKEEGGLDIPDIKLKKFAIRLKLLKKLCDENYDVIWKEVARKFFQKCGNMNLTLNVFSMTDLSISSIKIPHVYRELLQAWKSITNGNYYKPNDIKEIMTQPLFYNDHISVNRKTISFDLFKQARIVTIADICYEAINGFLPTDAICEIIEEKFPDVQRETIKNQYKIIKEAIPTSWREQITETTSNFEKEYNITLIEKNELITHPESFCVKYCYNIMREICFEQPTSYEYWSKLEIKVNWKKVWNNVYLSDKSRECIELDFKICHNIIYTNKKLYKMGKSDSTRCQVCNKDEEEDIYHCLISCSENRDLIYIIQELFINIQPEGYTKTEVIQWILLGYLYEGNKAYMFINILLSLYRQCVIRRRIISIETKRRLDPIRLFKKLVYEHFTTLYEQHQKTYTTGTFIHRYIMSNDIVAFTDNNNLLFNWPL